MNSYRDAPQKTSGLPSGIPYIIGNEAAERFSFYGMKTILAIFMTQFLLGKGRGGEGRDGKAWEGRDGTGRAWKGPEGK